ncbi:MAG: SufD family Fe-S cluster assembly protein [Erysipelotrichia bacterium]|jgi:Fe-S cluster assembly protein SufD|nr:SufD family Fe-S cluster assembly protein [Erysipelotrichia bacterium]
MESRSRQIIINECQSESIVLDLNDDLDNLDIHVGKKANLSLNLYNFGEAKNTKITVKIDDDGEIMLIMADFSRGRSKVEALFDLAGKNARGVWKLSTLASQNDDKKFDIHFQHLAINTYGLMDNYGVARNTSRLIFSGANDIVRGAKKSKTKQNAKIIVFDKGAIAKADPRLNINENEVEASHAAVVGKLSDDHLFYLMSRGLSLNEAKQLITYGYLMPIAKFFNENIQHQIATIIEERV